MIYFAHRGASALRVQNTVESFELAHARGARCFELDVHMLSDGALAVHHDYSLLSTVGIDIKLSNITKKELKKYPLQNPFTKTPVFVPLLQEVLPVLSYSLDILNIEIKNDGNVYPGIEKALINLLRVEYTDLLPHILFSSFDYATLERLRSIWPQARIGLLTRAFNIEEAAALKAESVHINQTRFTSQMACVCHQNGLKIYVYTVNEPSQAQDLQKAGADGIFTDNVHLFI
ncbi:MAG: hypothetical protein IKP96_01185 [Elusimicrobiaceae bacterium]|nr:hypothetical protein [Elusimicrobiaceae bacterium]